MENRILIAVFLFCALWTPAFSFFTGAELESYNVLVKPYGLDLAKFISKMSPDVWTCIKSHRDLQACNSTSLNVTSNNSSRELRQMFDKCPTGQLGCFQSQTNSSVQVVLKHLLNVMRQMCIGQCWKKLAIVSRTCILKNATGVKTAERNAFQFISEVLDATCSAPLVQGPTCAEKIINGILNTEHVGDPTHKELQQFYKNLGCCVGSVRDMIKCYGISTEEESFGAFVMDSYTLCHLEPPKVCKGTLCLVPTTSSHVLTQASSKTSKTSHSNATKIAGICIAALVIAVGLLILGRFIYQRIKRREKLHLEDYGYSRLKMMEDDLYNDFTDESDFEGFIAT